MAGDAAGLGREVERILAASAKTLQQSTKVAMRDAAKTARGEMRKTATIVPGPDRTFSNFQRAPLTVKIKNEPGAIVVIPRGVWGIAEEGARPHRAKIFGRDGFDHPGTRRTQGRRSWSRGAQATFVAVGQEVPEMIAKAVEATFRGA